MLHEIMKTLKTGMGPLSLRQLSHQLNVEESALEGMIGFLLKKGKLRLVDELAAAKGCTTCPLAGICTADTKLPRHYVLTEEASNIERG